MFAPFGSNVQHAVCSMLLTVPRCFDSREVIGRLLGAEGMGATPALDINHSVLSMFPAVHRHLAALHIEARSLSA